MYLIVQKKGNVWGYLGTLIMALGYTHRFFKLKVTYLICDVLIDLLKLKVMYLIVQKRAMFGGTWVP